MFVFAYPSWQNSIHGHYFKAILFSDSQCRFDPANSQKPLLLGLALPKIKQAGSY